MGRVGVGHKEQEMQEWQEWGAVGGVEVGHKEQEMQEWWVVGGHKEQEMQECRGEGEQAFLTQT